MCNFPKYEGPTVNCRGRTDPYVIELVIDELNELVNM
jgi:hypothetical protein